MSTLKVSNIQTPAGVDMYLCKAWVNFNGVGTVTINASGNVSSITDNGVGDYTINFTSPMVDANYAATGMARAQSAGAVSSVVLEENFSAAPTATAFRMITKQAGSPFDPTDCHVAFFR